MLKRDEEDASVVAIRRVAAVKAETETRMNQEGE